MSQLLITLNPPGSSATDYSYAQLSNAGNLTMQGRAAPALLPKADSATLVLPAQALSWHTVQLPKLARGTSVQKIQAVLAGLLEDQLLDEPAHLHLALWRASEEGTHWVAACSKAWLQEAVKTLQSAGVPLSGMVPQFFPGAEPRLHVSGTPDAAQIHASDAQGVLSLPLAQHALLPALQDVPITAEPAVAAAAEQALQQRVDVMQGAQLAVQAFQQAKAQGLDLAQAELVLAGGGRWLQTFSQGLNDLLAAPQWAPARWGIALLLLINLIGLNVWAWREQASMQAKRQQMNQLLTSSFPNVKAVVDAPVQMQRELANLRQAQGQLSGRDFESIYARYAAASGLQTAPAAIDFASSEVVIRGAGLQASQMQELLPRLQYAGLNVKSEAQTVIVSHRDEGGAK